MFWSLVRPDRILLPITRSAAVTTSLDAGELAVVMITCGGRNRGQMTARILPDRIFGNDRAQRSEASLQPRPRKGCFRALLQLLLMVSEKEDAGGGQANRRDQQ